MVSRMSVITDSDRELRSKRLTVIDDASQIDTPAISIRFTVDSQCNTCRVSEYAQSILCNEESFT